MVMMSKTRIGVLALQGAFREHLEMLDNLGAEGRTVRRAEELPGLDGLIIPGGESTTIGKLAADWGLLPTLAELTGSGMPVWGTCAGMILLAKDIGREQPLIGVMDIVVARNAFGRQVDSFEVDLPVPALDGNNTSFRAIFIRAPLIERVGPGVEVLARLEDGAIVAARQGNLLVTAFHPELTDDTRFHRYFLGMVEPDNATSLRSSE
jgi:5'-phosphate synthase pdxT subunit